MPDNNNNSLYAAAIVRDAVKHGLCRAAVAHGLARAVRRQAFVRLDDYVRSLATAACARTGMDVPRTLACAVGMALAGELPPAALPAEYRATGACLVSLPPGASFALVDHTDAAVEALAVAGLLALARTA